MENNQKGIIVVLAILAIWGIFFQQSKYEGMTAEEWFSEYDAMEADYQNFRSCVEDYDSFDISTQLQYGGVFYYCE